ncbi:hypothetical protein [Streptomyces mayteni]
MVTMVVLGVAGCGTADSLEPDGGPRPALTSDASPEEGPEPDQEITDPSPQEGLTTTLPEPTPEETEAPAPDPEPTDDAPPPGTEPPPPGGDGADEAMSAFCEAAVDWQDFWDDQIRDLCEPYLAG